MGGHLAILLFKENGEKSFWLVLNEYLLTKDPTKELFPFIKPMNTQLNIIYYHCRV